MLVNKYVQKRTGGRDSSSPTDLRRNENQKSSEDIQGGLRQYSRTIKLRHAKLGVAKLLIASPTSDYFPSRCRYLFTAQTNAKFACRPIGWARSFGAWTVKLPSSFRNSIHRYYELETGSNAEPDERSKRLIETTKLTMVPTKLRASRFKSNLHPMALRQRMLTTQFFLSPHHRRTQGFYGQNRGEWSNR